MYNRLTKDRIVQQTTAGTFYLMPIESVKHDQDYDLVIPPHLFESVCGTELVDVFTNVSFWGYLSITDLLNFKNWSAGVKGLKTYFTDSIYYRMKANDYEGMNALADYNLIKFDKDETLDSFRSSVLGRNHRSNLKTLFKSYRPITMECFSPNDAIPMKELTAINKMLASVSDTSKFDGHNSNLHYLYLNQACNKTPWVNSKDNYYDLDYIAALSKIKYFVIYDEETNEIIGVDLGCLHEGVYYGFVKLRCNLAYNASSILLAQVMYLSKNNVNCIDVSNVVLSTEELYKKQFFTEEVKIPVWASSAMLDGSPWLTKL